MDKPSRRARFVVIPVFKVKEESMSAFRAGAMDDAKHSAEEEPGRGQFDVVRPGNAQDTVIFREVYDDRAAFDAHLETARPRRFQAAMKALAVTETQVRLAARAYPQRAAGKSCLCLGATGKWLEGFVNVSASSAPESWADTWRAAWPKLGSR
jgi:quinol monooxygenase YgiN